MSINRAELLQRDETIRRFGYDPIELIKKSKELIVYRCSCCYRSNVTKYINFNHPRFSGRCQSCARSLAHANPDSGYHTEEYKKKRSEITTRHNKTKKDYSRFRKKYEPYIEAVINGKMSFLELSNLLQVDDSTVCTWFHRNHKYRSPIKNVSLEEEAVYQNRRQLFTDISRQVRYSSDLRNRSDFYSPVVGHMEYDGAGFYHVLKKADTHINERFSPIRLTAQAYWGQLPYLQWKFGFPTSGYTAVMSPKQYKVERLAKQKAATLLLADCHSLGNCSGQVTFGLYHDDHLIGVAKFGLPTNRYDRNAIELRRFFVLDGTPRNTESWFLSQCEKQFPKGTHLVTYIHSHEKGSYLRALEWTQVQSRPHKDYDFYSINGKLYNRRTVWGWAKRIGLVDKVGTEQAKELLCKMAGGQKVMVPQKIKFEKILK